jgi:hypothetical protein
MPDGLVDGPEAMRARSASSSGPGRRDQGGDHRRGPIPHRRPPPRPLPRRRADRPGDRGGRGRPLGDGPRPGRRRHQGGRPGRGPLDRARHLPGRRGHRADAGPGRLAGPDPGRAPRGAGRGRGRGGDPRGVRRKAAEVVEIHADSFRRAVAAGVKVAMGTDSGSPPTAATWPSWS